MYEHAQKRKEQEMRFMAGIHGIKIEKDKEDSFKFRDPKEYEHLPMEERKKLTEEMKKGHVSWAGQESPMDRSGKLREALKK